MLVIGLTGGIGSGKSTVAKLFAERGIAIIDTDVIARDLTQSNQPGFKKIIEAFGDEIIKNKELDRAALRKIIFCDPEKRKFLENILHPLIRDEIKNQIAKIQSPYCIVVIPLLFETERNPVINRILVVDSPETHQFERTQKRDNLTEEEVNAIIKTQVTRSQRLLEANDVILNDHHIEDLIPQVQKLHEMYLKLAS